MNLIVGNSSKGWKSDITMHDSGNFLRSIQHCTVLGGGGMLVDCLIDCSLFVAECRDTNIHSYSAKLQQFLPALGCWLCWYRSAAFFWLAVV